MVYINIQMVNIYIYYNPYKPHIFSDFAAAPPASSNSKVVQRR
jgi:hypothetical protein